MARINRKRQRLSTDAASDSENDEDADSSPAKRPGLIGLTEAYFI